MTTTRSAAALAAAACLAVLTGCAGHAAAPGAGASRSPSASTTAPASTPATTAPGGQVSAPRCHTSQLSLAFTGFNEASGGQRGMTLILANHSGTTCYVYGYPGLAFFNGSGFPMTTHLTWVPQPHALVLLRPAGNAQALLTWRANTATGPAPFHPDLVHVTPPDEYAYLWAIWPGGPVRGGSIAAWPLRAAPAGPFPAGTGTIAGPFNGMCMTLAAGGTTVELRTCSPGAGSQQWTGYNDGTLRTGSRCLDVTGPGAGAKVQVAACTGAASQKWEIGQVSYNDFGPIANAGTGTVLSYPRGSIADGTPLVTGPDLGDQSSPWHVSFRPYMT
jgi:uncharacterized protein DUF4232/ricin-type beta-trefoil lectin protein